MPFLKLTRDRRGTENTFLMHADRPGDRPRLLYWYRTAPGVLLGRSPLDEDAIRTIEEQHPDIDFDWPAILALSEVMTPEEEAPVPRQSQQSRQPKKRREREGDADRRPAREPRRDDGGEAAESQTPDEHRADDQVAADVTVDSDAEVSESISDDDFAPSTTHGLLEELVGREISTRLRGRYSEILARINEHGGDATSRDGWVKRAAPLNPDSWLTPDAILEGIRTADNLFEQLRVELIHSR